MDNTILRMNNNGLNLLRMDILDSSIYSSLGLNHVGGGKNRMEFR